MGTITFPHNQLDFYFPVTPSHFRLTPEEDMDERRKREDDDGASGGRKRAKGLESAAVGEQAAAAPTEEEVEEFYAILRRIHTAVKYFEKDKKGKRSRRLTLSEREAPPKDDGAPRSRRSDHPGLDLNSEPSSESNVASGL